MENALSRKVADIERAVEETKAQFGHIDVVFANAGATTVAPLEAGRKPPSVVLRVVFHSRARRDLIDLYECFELAPNDTLTLIWSAPDTGDAIQICFIDERQLVVSPEGKIDNMQFLINGEPGRDRSWAFKRA